MTSKAKSESVKVGHSVDLNGKGAFLRYEDGTVVTVRAMHTFTKPGEYVVIVDGDETTYKVSEG